jgi:hypothetical protein
LAGGFAFRAIVYRHQFAGQLLGYTRTRAPKIKESLTLAPTNSMLKRALKQLLFLLEIAFLASRLESTPAESFLAL